MRTIIIAGAVLLVGLTGCGSGGDLAQQYQPYPPSLSVNGVGTATGIADMAVITFSINVSQGDPAEAMAEATELADSATEAALAMGIAAEDIETMGYSIYMEEEYDYNTYEYTGENIYRLTHSFVVKVRNIEDAGDVLSALVVGGATTVSGIQFTVENREELVTEARNKALRNAGDAARQLADGLDISLGDPVSVSEWIDYYAAGNPYGYDSFDGEYYYDSPSVSSGSTSITMNVSISYAIR